MKTVQQNILTVKSGIIVHQVNKRGVMGAGLAKAIRDKWPVVYRVYKSNPPALGKVQLVWVSSALAIANLCAQDGYGRDRRYTQYGAMKAGLEALAVRAGDKQIYVPSGIGCGLGGGNWNIVLDIIRETIPNAIICKLGG